ncbi:DUF5655 domain-containing protein [uncultured Microbacterium sp.]|uniref:DUF5655 domain-containing protein n=1 Tax=uncultured Microbacterium sp. TaxID=191216 RepID=UPI0025D5B033|nr:DUF5655 domain-containing protein [uncultured Microbacterium sp.]
MSLTDPTRTIPTGLATDEFALRPIRASDASRDYTAVMETRVDLRIWEQSSWPEDKRKFLWCWAYEKTADGTLYVMVTLDRELDDPNFHDVSQVSKNRWNHNVVVKTAETANSGWLRKLIRAGYDLARS